ncbi:efflux RND transporter permease subunit [Nitrococcus mobilis]|uniref:Heavy metal efflux pump CzcA n=1 Tax=Nitrococcus mobilis Nb-231 TaxID=314278 RepID=A4BRR0_9GAMM|nr:CusA/CzcA family heavy metal efflux RND transporter [Nitrococcus mobilis]EAR21631.1 Heavy metal efflux pump CzcA [Nitrococcus mobilis Nb-231]
MIDRLVQAALNNRLLTLVLVAGLAGGGIYSFQRVPIDSFPDVTPTMVQVFTASPGLSPVDVETLISYPVEISMYGLPGLERVQSTSIFGLSRVNVYFEDGTDIYLARRLVMERLAKAREEIPAGLGKPQLGPITTGLGRVFLYTLENQKGTDFSPMDLRTAQDWIVKPMLRTVPGVTDVLSIGGYERQYQVRLDQNALIARDLSVADARRAIAANNRNVGASFINRAGEEYIIRGYGWVQPGEAGLEDIRNILIREQEGTPVYLRDVAEVRYGPAIRRGALIANGEEAVGGYVLKLIYTNTQKLLGALEEKVAAINDALPDGMVLKEYYSQGDLIEKAVGTVEGALLEGALLVLLLLYLFLGNLRSTLIVIASLPLAVLVAFIAMDYVGLSANLMSLGGLAIGIGMMVDGAVVMVENIFRHLEERVDEDVSMLRLVDEAAREVAQPIVFAIGIIIIVFLPLFTLQGVEGKMFSPMAYTISFALAGALLMALTLVPVLSSLVFSKKTAPRGEPRLLLWLKAGYRPLLTAVVARPKTVFASAVMLFAASLALFPLLGIEFVPTLREGTFLVRSTLPPGANLPKAIDYAGHLQEIFNDFPEVTGSYARVGRGEVGGDPEPVNVVASVVTLKPLEEWRSGRDYEALQTAMAERVKEELPGLANNFSQPIALRTDELLSGIMAEVVISLYGNDLEQLARYGERIKEITEQVEGAVDVRLQQQDGKPQVVVRPDRRELARYGIALDAVLAAVETGIGGSIAGQVFEGIRRFDIFVRLAADERDRISKIRELPLRTAGGALIPLSRVADVEVFIGPKKISRAKASRRIFVQLNVRGRDMDSVVTAIQQQVAAEVELPAGYYVEYGGQFENQRRAMQTLYVVVPITLSLIFLMLFLAFGRLRYAVLIFLNVPFAVSGGIVALWLSGLYLSVPGAVGFIAVFGVAVLNGVVMVAYINELREKGMAMGEAVRVGAERRLRPVLMTASAAILGLIPLLLAGGIGANVQRPLAAVVIGGLVTSTLLTLLVLPSVYRWFAVARRDKQAHGTLMDRRST